MFGWMSDFRFTSFFTVFQSFQNDGWVIMKGCIQWNPLYAFSGSRIRDSQIYSVLHIELTGPLNLVDESGIMKECV